MDTRTTSPTPRPLWHNRLACPICKADLQCSGSGCKCSDPACGAGFPLIDGVPVLINEATSIFAINDFLDRRVTTFAECDPGTPFKRPGLLRRLVPSNSRLVAEGLSSRFLSELKGTDLWVLVIGAGDERYDGHEHIHVIYSDVYLGPGVDLIADGHDIPFQDGCMDAVLAISVMEHVADPKRCAAEITRVLKPRGRILAMTPFMQQVHLGRYDFTRFTHLGHRRLWNHYREIDSGISCGPGMALAWAWQYFLLSFSENQTTRKYLRALAKLSSFPLPLFDEYLKDKRGAIDGASSFYFLGEKTETPISDRDIVRGYRGLDNLG